MIGASKRDYEIVNLYSKGYTMQSIGDIYCLSRERIRQIVEAKSYLIDKKYVLKKKLNTNRIMYQGKLWTRTNLLRTYFPNFSKSQIHTVLAELRCYSKENKLSLDDCLSKFVNTRIKFWKKGNYKNRS